VKKKKKLMKMFLPTW